MTLPERRARSAAALAAAIEHVMRISDDDGDVAVLLSTASLDPRRLEALVGRLTARTRVAIAPGTPLAALITGEVVRSSWRAGCPPQPGSLFCQWQFLHQLATGSPLTETEPPDGDVYGHLEMLRAAHDQP